ncbi:MAG: hypothetical protein WB689_06845, partial [Xanthobacteraceae bacterium]
SRLLIWKTSFVFRKVIGAPGIWSFTTLLTAQLKRTSCPGASGTHAGDGLFAARRPRCQLAE